ncbi:MAG: hypothetical protein ACREL5_12370 [Gemmatimonadales bacterium]
MIDPAVSALGWLIFAVGIGVILIAAVPRKSGRRSPTHRVAGVASGLVFCLLSGTVIMPGLTGNGQLALLIAGAVMAAASWYLGRHARRVDRMARRARS